MIRKTGKVNLVANKSRHSPKVHLKKHLHLTNYIHLKQHGHMQEIMKVDTENGSEFSLIRELSNLKKTRLLRDPSTSPTCKSGSLIQRLHREMNMDGPHWQVPSCDEDPRTLDRMVAVPDNLVRSAAFGGSSDFAEEEEDDDESSGKEGWVEINPEDGKQLRAYTYHSHGPAMLMNHISSEAEAEAEGEGSILLHNWDTKVRPLDFRISKKEYLNGLQEKYGDLLSRVATRSHDRERDNMSFSRDGHSVESERQTPISDYETTIKSRPRTASSRKTKLHRARRLYANSPSGSQISTSHDMWNRVSPDLMSEGAVVAPRESDELDISELPQSRCGIPWNWSRIHARGKHSLDITDRSTLYGVSDARSRGVGKALSRGVSSSEDSIAMTTSEFSDTSFNTDLESFPLLSLNSDTSEGMVDDHNSCKSKRRAHGHSMGMESNLSLSQKYMPKTFEDIVGQNLITQALTNALSKKRVARIYIFYGPRGTGKTSCARVFAKVLNCTSLEDQRPCESCPECLLHASGKTSTVKEVNAGVLQGSRGIRMLMHVISRSSSSQHKVFIVDECHTLSNQAWNSFIKAVEDAPRNIVFILSTSSLEHLPHAVVSRCQKFIFSKIKESDIINRLKLIAAQEGLDVDTEAFKLIASTCDGSLRDAEMMLDQLSLLGHKISLSMTQELMGLVPDEKLVNLLDYALSADTINTVRYMKELMVSGVEPLNLMSQLACLITSLLAGSYQIPKGKAKRKFFRKRHLAKEDMERLRQALRVLSEAEKQLRVSSDRTTWLTAALLQFAPDQSYLLPNSSADTSFNQSPAGINASNVLTEPSSSNFQRAENGCFYGMSSRAGSGSTDEGMTQSSGFLKTSTDDTQQSSNLASQTQLSSSNSRSARVVPEAGTNIQRTWSEDGQATIWHTTLTKDFELDEVWQRVLDAVHSSSLRKFLQTQGKLLSLSLSKGFAAAVLEFNQIESNSRAERSRTSIAHAFQVTLGYPVDIKVRLAAEKEDPIRRQAISGDQPTSSSSLWLPAWTSGNCKYHSDGSEKYWDNDTNSQLVHHTSDQGQEVNAAPVDSNEVQTLQTKDGLEIVPLESVDNSTHPAISVHDASSVALEDKLESAWVQGASSSGELWKSSSRNERHSVSNCFRSNSNGKQGISLAYAIQQDDTNVYRKSDYTNRHGNQNYRHSMSDIHYGGVIDDMSAKLEEENLRLESSSSGSSLLCWKSTDGGHEKVNQLHDSPKKHGFLLGLCRCAKANGS